MAFFLLIFPLGGKVEKQAEKDEAENEILEIFARLGSLQHSCTLMTRTLSPFKATS